MGIERVADKAHAIKESLKTDQVLIDKKAGIIEISVGKTTGVLVKSVCVNGVERTTVDLKHYYDEGQSVNLDELVGIKTLEQAVVFEDRKEFTEIPIIGRQIISVGASGMITKFNLN